MLGCTLGRVWFYPKLTPPKYWLAKISVKVLVDQDLANVDTKSELMLAKGQGHAKILSTIQRRSKTSVMTNYFCKIYTGYKPNTLNFLACFSLINSKNSS
jgi:hypothetical protein